MTRLDVCLRRRVAPGEGRMVALDSGIDHRPGDVVAAYVEQPEGGVRLHRLARGQGRLSHRPVAGDPPDQRIRARLAASASSSADDALDDPRLQRFELQRSLDFRNLGIPARRRLRRSGSEFARSRTAGRQAASPPSPTSGAPEAGPALRERPDRPRASGSNGRPLSCRMKRSRALATHSVRGRTTLISSSKVSFAPTKL